MWFVMEKAQTSYTLSEKLRRTISEAGQPGSCGVAAVEDLLAQGADVNQPSGNYLPLHTACVNGNVGLARLLLSRNAQVNSVDGFGRAALHYAAEKSVECVELLLDHGAIVDIRDRNNNTPLHWASYKNRYQCLRLLLERGADPNAVDHNMDTPLSWAALKGNLESIRVLLLYNANANTRNLNGSSPVSRLLQTIAIGIGSVQEEQSLDLLLAALGGQLDIRDPVSGAFPDLIERDESIQPQLLAYCCNVQPLEVLCRCAIRRSIGPRYLPDAIDYLQLPESVTRFLLLQA